MRFAMVKLEDGVEFGGARHTALRLRTPTLGDSIRAEQAAEGKGGNAFILSYLSGAITNFGVLDEDGVFTDEIPKENIDGDLLSRLTDADFERISLALNTLKKNGFWLRILSQGK